MGIDVKVKLGRIDTDRILEEAMDDHVKRALEGIRCQEHGSRPKIVRRGTDIEIKACCDALLEAARKRLGS